jgi:hypothetical protein
MISKVEIYVVDCCYKVVLIRSHSKLRQDVLARPFVHYACIRSLRRRISLDI